MVKIAICDDETEFLDILSESLSSWCRAHQLTLQLYRFTVFGKELGQGEIEGVAQFFDRANRRQHLFSIP